MKLHALNQNCTLYCLVCIIIFLITGCQPSPSIYSHIQASSTKFPEWNDPKLEVVPTQSPAIASTSKDLHVIFPDLESNTRGLSRNQQHNIVGLAAYVPGIERITANGQELVFNNSNNYYKKFLIEPGARTVQFQIPHKMVMSSSLLEITATGTDGKKTQRQLRINNGKPSVVNEGSSDEGRKILERGNYWALLIANQNYTKGIDTLRTPFNDVQALKKVLVKHYGFQSDHVFIQTDADLNTMKHALDHIHDQVEGNDSLLLYYAGHGHLDDEYGGKGFWIPIDGKPPSSTSSGYRTSWLPNSHVHDMIQASRAKHILLISDSCYSGTFKTRNIGKPQSYAASMNFFYKKAASRSRRAITSGNLEPVADGGGGRHSVFSYHLLKVLKDAKRTLNAEHLFQQLRDSITGTTQQSPQYFIIDKQNDKGGDFVFLSR